MALALRPPARDRPTPRASPPNVTTPPIQPGNPRDLSRVPPLLLTLCRRRQHRATRPERHDHRPATAHTGRRPTGRHTPQLAPSHTGHSGHRLAGHRASSPPRRMSLHIAPHARAERASSPGPARGDAAPAPPVRHQGTPRHFTGPDVRTDSASHARFATSHARFAAPKAQASAPHREPPAHLAATASGEPAFRAAETSAGITLKQVCVRRKLTPYANELSPRGVMCPRSRSSSRSSGWAGWC